MQTKIKLLFVCHGNICRSPMAEYVMKYLTQLHSISSDFYIASAATSTEEIGNDMHPGTKKKLSSEKIPYEKHTARQLHTSDYDAFDLLLGMDQENILRMHQFFPKDPAHKIHKLLSFSGSSADIADPWYTGNFDRTYQDILIGTSSLLKYLLPEAEINKDNLPNL